jgi:regulation of enolase protein 1 (concanavalin A-like superfamily)
MCRYLGVGLACLLAAPCVVASEQGIPAAKLVGLKAATVYVKVEGEEGTATGSGFLIGVDGDAGLIVTNQHVIADESGRSQPPSVVFGSGTKTERVLRAEVVASDPEADLAVLRVTAPGLPTPLDVTQAVPLRETMTVYTFGFPLGNLLSSGKGNPAVTIGQGTVSSLREDERGRLHRIQLDGDINPGNSGGPVVDGEGRLVGIAVSKIVDTRIGFAIPSAHLHNMLQGRVAALAIQAVNVTAGTAEVDVAVPCIDPLRKLKALEVRAVRKDALKEAPQADKDGNWPDLPGADRVGLKIEGGKGKGRLTLRSAEPKAVVYLFQTSYTNGDGKAVATEPLARTINFAATGEVRATDPNAGLGRVWETVSTKEGDFTVDMPVKPDYTASRSRSGPGGTLRVFMTGCRTATGTYFALRIGFPRVIIRGDVERALDAERDSLAEEWNGKVISEKHVRAEGKVGRDFTIRGRPQEEAGVLTIRVRQYLVANALYVVAVVSRPGRGLPEDAGRFLGSLALGPGQARAAGTPEPEPTGRPLGEWGLAIDPDRDCTFDPGERRLAVKVPGTLHDLNPDSGKLNALRVVRPVEGDFVVRVKVAGDFQPGGRSTNPRGVPYNGAGIVIWSDSDNFIRLERGAMLRGGRVGTYVAFEEREGGYRGAVHNEVFPAGPCYLRLERKGSRILGAVSLDGSRWKQLQPIDTVWPDRLKVGLLAINSSTEPFAPAFEEFSLKANGGDEGGKKADGDPPPRP